MKINSRILSIHPYISTSWKNIASIHMIEKTSGPLLIVNLHSGQIVEIPGLQREIISQIFESHAQFLEQDSLQVKEGNSNAPLSFGLPLKLGIEGLEGIGNAMQHNPQQANMPDLPSEILEKVTNISKALGIDETAENFPKPEPHCNCMYCQISRALHAGKQIHATQHEANDEELVTEEDLKFKDWQINQTNDNLYIVTNPLDLEEHYQVYLGNPIGCTCGQKNCEHIRAVLNS